MSSKYERLKLVGSGSYGEVWKARRKGKNSTKFYACKIIDFAQSNDDLETILQEIVFLKDLDHPNITKFYESFIHKNTVWIVMEYINRGSGTELVDKSPCQFGKKGLPENIIAIICREMLKGLDYVHKKRKIHRDIKAGNVLFNSKGEVKLADFGVSAQLDKQTKAKMTVIGTPYWMAPEVIIGSGTTTTADIWSLGITAIEFAKGVPPLVGMAPMRALMKIPNLPPPKLEGKYTKQFKDFIASCLIKDPRKRPSAEKLLKHPFIKSAGDKSILSKRVNQTFQHQSVRIKPSRSSSRSLKFNTDHEVVIPKSTEQEAPNNGLSFVIGSTPDIQTVIYNSDTVKTSSGKDNIDEGFITMKDHPENAKSALLKSIKQRIEETESKSDTKHLKSLKKALKDVNSGIIGALLDKTLDIFEDSIE